MSVFQSILVLQFGSSVTGGGIFETRKCWQRATNSGKHEIIRWRKDIEKRDLRGKWITKHHTHTASALIQNLSLHPWSSTRNKPFSPSNHKKNCLGMCNTLFEPTCRSGLNWFSSRKWSLLRDSHILFPQRTLWCRKRSWLFPVDMTAYMPYLTLIKSQRILPIWKAIGQFHNCKFYRLANPHIISLIQNEACGVSQTTMTDRQTVTKYTKADLWKLPCNKQSLFFFMTLLHIAFQLNLVPHPKEDRCCLYEVILNVMDFK